MYIILFLRLNTFNFHNCLTKIYLNISINILSKIHMLNLKLATLGHMNTRPHLHKITFYKFLDITNSLQWLILIQIQVTPSG